MNEPKRRGRPPKVKTEPNARVEGAALPVGCAECGQAVGHYDDCGAGMGVVSTFPTTIANDARRIEPGEVVQVYEDPFGAMKAEVINTWAASRSQAYAERVWNGQSPDVPRAERLERVKRALDGQGLSMEGVEL
jgi:hypothetical protein